MASVWGLNLMLVEVVRDTCEVCVPVGGGGEDDCGDQQEHQFKESSSWSLS